ncbi:MAG: hypothetical protein WCK65_06330 [Rhodospirillaceae bacterium]
MNSIRAKALGKDRDNLSISEKTQPAQGRSDNKVEFDNEKLLCLLRSAKGELHGLRLVHMHLSLLRERDPGQQLIVRTVVNELAHKATFLQVYSISNGDVIALYKGIKLSSVTEICLKLEQLFLARTVLIGPNPYRETSLYSVMELSLNFINVIRFIEELVHGDSAAAQETKPPITLEEMGKLERAMSNFDLSPFMLNQPMISISEQVASDTEYYELYISIKLLEERLCPNYDLAANKWLFAYFTQVLDQSVLRALGYGLTFMRGRRIGININLSSVISTGFVKFDERLPVDFRSNVVLEIAKSDLIENMPLFEEVREFAREKRYGIAIDGLNIFCMTNFNFEQLNIQYAKLYWTPELSEIDGDVKDCLVRRISEQKQCQVVLARCDSVTSLLFARDVGINLVQGRVVDNIIRKGVSVREAVKTALATPNSASKS